MEQQRPQVVAVCWASSLAQSSLSSLSDEEGAADSEPGSAEVITQFLRVLWSGSGSSVGQMVPKVGPTVRKDWRL